jgi:hypothetical protein
MSKNFLLWDNAQDDHFQIQISKKEEGSPSGRSQGWWIKNVPSEKSASVYTQIRDIINAAGGQSDFDQAAKLIDEKFQALCETLGCPLAPVT